MNAKTIRKWLVLGGLMLLAGTASADFNVQDKGTYYNNASTGLKTDVLGNLKVTQDDPDRDFPLLTQFFSGQTLTAGASYSMPYAIPTMQYTRGAIMLTWAQSAADSDSVRIAVKVFGTTSSTSGNWHLWTPDGPTQNPADSCSMNGPVAADTGAAGLGRCAQPLSYFVMRPIGSNPFSIYGITVPAACQTVYNGPGVSGAGRMRIRRMLPRGILRWCSANGVMLNLTDNSGAPCPFPYIRIEVTNASTGSTLTNVEANLWPRVQ